MSASRPHPEANPLTLDLTAADRILVFGGPYSNLEATEALHRETGRLKLAAEQVICTGDVVAYCADAEATATLIRTWGVHVVAGNCEEQIGADAGDCACGFASGSACDQLARNWYEHARRQVEAANKRWMAALPRRLRFAFAGMTCEVIHGGFDLVNRWVFASTRGAIADELRKTNADLVIAGHSGIPFARSIGRQTWFNPGVIGMPANTGQAGGWYGLLTRNRGGVRLTTHRLAYRHGSAARKLRQAGFADPYAKALMTGLWPSLDVLPVAERQATGRPLAPITLELPAAGASLANAAGEAAANPIKSPAPSSRPDRP